MSFNSRSASPETLYIDLIVHDDVVIVDVNSDSNSKTNNAESDVTKRHDLGQCQFSYVVWRRIHEDVEILVTQRRDHFVLPPKAVDALTYADKTALAFFKIMPQLVQAYDRISRKWIVATNCRVFFGLITKNIVDWAKKGNFSEHRLGAVWQKLYSLFYESRGNDFRFRILDSKHCLVPN